jgi:nucleoside-diphosphate-sugar epimerase
VAESNSQIDYNVFKFCTETGTGLIYASGTSVYGLGDGRIKRESGDIDPVGPYVEQNAESERVGLELFPVRGLQFAALRICAPHNPGQNARTVLNIFIERALNGMPLLYHGTGSRQQDYSYISDIETAVSLVAVKRKSGIFNIAGGMPITMKRLAELVIRSVPNCKSEVKPSGREDPQEGSVALFSIERARDELGWATQVNLEEGLRRCVQNRLKENP